MITKFIKIPMKIVGSRPKTIKLKPQSKPKLKKFTAQDSLFRQETAGKIARRVETRSHLNLTKKVESAFQRTISKPKKANQFTALVKQKQRALTRAFTLSQKRGKSALQKSSTKLNVGIRRFGSQKTKSYAGISPSEARQLGFPPKEVSSEMKAFYAKGSPKAQLKKYRATLSKIYASPKSWKQRSNLKSVYRARAKAELGAAKVDRSIFRGTTVQKQTKSGSWKTIHSPEKTFDVRTKRWK
tara:strand:- start:41 stop:766 length:726 start_codon:yes stop_codon:yes gene_type:complete